MKQKVFIVLSIVMAFFLGSVTMYFIVVNFPIKTETVQKVLNEYKIEESAITDAIDKTYDGVVVVESYKNNNIIGTGTGFIYKKDSKHGYIITNAHVVDGSDRIDVIFSNDTVVTVDLLGSDVYADIAVLSVPSEKVLTVLEIGNSENMKLGNTVFTIGAPMGTDYSGTVTKGILSGKDRIVSVSLSSNGTSDWMIRVLQTDAAINPGNSGGPLLNIAGEVIGINSLKLVEDKIEGMGFAIPIEEAMEYVEKLEKGEEIPRPMLGVGLIDLTETFTLYRVGIIIDDDVESGVVVASVSEDSPAYKSGLKKGDVILELNNKKVTNKAELRYELYKNSPGDKIKLKVYRDGKIKDYEAILVDIKS